MLKKSPLKVGQLLGEGLNARVYQASSTSVEFGVAQNYALKVLKRKEDLKHFKKEFHTLSKVSGPHLVKLYGWSKHKRKPALLLEYIEGLDLKKLLDEKSLSAEESNWIYHETMAGLKELDSHNLYHGDLSPKNIMITKDGNIKLIDFGLTEWRTKQIEVTPEFVSPKILHGDSPSFAHDFYSLNKIFEHFSLFKSETAPLSAPSTLSKKISSLLETQTLPTGQNITKRLLTLILISLAFFKPVSATNKVFQASSLSIRSNNWLSVKLTPRSKGCFTPCTLDLPSLGQHKIYWKSQSSSGSTNIFVNHNGQVLLMNF